MMITKKWMWLLAGALTFSGAGCHYLQPNQLHKLNRVPDSMPGDAYNFSIPDPPLSAEGGDSLHPLPSCSSNLCVE